MAAPRFPLAPDQPCESSSQEMNSFIFKERLLAQSAKEAKIRHIRAWQGAAKGFALLAGLPLSCALSQLLLLVAFQNQDCPSLSGSTVCGGTLM